MSRPLPRPGLPRVPSPSLVLHESTLRSAVLLALVGWGTACQGCHNENWGGPAKALPSAPAEGAAPRPSSRAADGRDQVDASDAGDPDRGAPDALSSRRDRARPPPLDAKVDRGSPSFARITKTCGDASGKSIDAGYEGWDWGTAGLACAFLFHRGGDRARVETSVRYLKALLDDKKKVGDGLGGEHVVEHDSGYPIRTHGLMAALLVDWLRDAPALTPQLKKHALDRFVAWTDWYRQKGYMRDHPVSNYYVGYFGTVAMAGLALEKEDPRATELRTRAKTMYEKEIVPAFGKLDGGGWPEGWQYGAGVATTLALYTDREPGVGRLPWLDAVPAYRANSEWPDGSHVYDDGDWSKKPAVANPKELFGLIDRSLPERGAETSYFARGTGTVFVRTSWDRNATWASFAASPFLGDHQHIDAGHFELVRGGDPLVVDGGGYGAGSSLAHNVLLVTDESRGELAKYEPNQTPERSTAKITRFEDTNGVLVATADLASAYLPPRQVDDAKSAVKSYERTFLFSRTPIPGAEGSARLVVADRIVLASPDADVAFAVHSYAEPVGAVGACGTPVKFARGASSAWMTTLVPSDGTREVVRAPSKPTNPLIAKKSDGSFWWNDEPPEGVSSFRVDVSSPKGSADRRFLHFFSTGPSGSPAPDPRLLKITAGDAVGASVAGEAYVVTFGSGPVAYEAPAGALRHVVTGLAPDKTFSVGVSRAGDACAVRLGTSGGPLERPSSKAGTLTLALDPTCVVR